MFIKKNQSSTYTLSLLQRGKAFIVVYVSQIMCGYDVNFSVTVAVTSLVDLFNKQQK